MKICLRNTLLIFAGSALILAVVAIYMLRNKTRYIPLYTFDEASRQQVPLSSNANANEVRFRSEKIRTEIEILTRREIPGTLKGLISTSVSITKTKLHYETSTLLGRTNTEPDKAYRQHDIDWLYRTGAANCIGYAYLFAAVFNELKYHTQKFKDCTVRIIYQSPVEMAFGCKRVLHTWNQIIPENGKAIYIDALAADWHLPWNVTKFVKELYQGG
jgi:hypothetical protein